ncbi:MAG: pyrroline-5-carboxylate reductase dimerization domain-containing protein [Tepidamorphaceae bacterium]
MALDRTVGVIGGTGQLGGAIVRGWLSSGVVAPENLWISNRSGINTAFPEWGGITFCTDNQQLADTCDVILLSVPPAQFGAVDIDAGDSLIMSVMAGVTIEDMAGKTGAKRIIRCMSSPAAGLRLAYSVWCEGDGVTAEDREAAQRLLSACGVADEVPDERQIDLFTAMTGPVPGFVAMYAKCMTDYAVNRGIDPAVADRAIRQLFLASGTIFAHEKPTPADHVKEMIDYAGTTAAGLLAMRNSPLYDSIEAGLDAAVEKARSIAR